MDARMADKPESSLENGHHFWESEVELTRKRMVTQDGKRFRYFDDKGIFNFTFFTWVSKWVRATARGYLDPYSLHPPPLADQLLVWQPIFSRHISDGIARMEEWESRMGVERNVKRAPKPVKYILWRAIWLTFWKRILISFFGVTLIGIGGMSISFLYSELMDEVNTKTFTLRFTIPVSSGVIALELLKGLLADHFNNYMQRTILLIQYSISTAVFQHGLCYRRSQFGNFHSKEGSCRSIIHGCSGEDMCSANPLTCPARRYKNNEIAPKIYSFQAVDAYYVPLFIESFTIIFMLMINLFYAIRLIALKLTPNIEPVVINVYSIIPIMVVIEVLNTYLFKFLYAIRDHRISKSSEILSSLSLIDKMSMDDVGHNVITEARNGELYFVIIRLFLSLFNKIIHTFSVTLAIYQIMDDFVEKVRAFHVELLNTSGLLTVVFVMFKIIDYMYLFPQSLKFITYSIRSYFRLETFFRTCSPNFYLPDNKFTGEASLPEMTTSDSASTQSLPKGLVVMFKKASFAWVNSRRDLLDKTGTTCLENLDFILNTGDLAIVTGAHGSGKTNFVKAILGDMTLVDGSMAVLPLSTNMPIFYASQDVWIQKGTIRSNITFGHKFDEDIYNTVIKAIELEHDISTWEEGDLRKISEHGYSLSGGQRVRIGLARAIYAYLIYSKMNEENGSRHSFLVVLDDPFTSLDPFVARIIFKNLFDKKRGLLIKDDVATVLTISKRILEDCTSSELTSFPDAPVYNLRNKTLTRSPSLVTGDTTSTIKPSTHSVDLSDSLSGDLRVMTSSGECTREKRRSIMQELYKKPAVNHGKKDGKVHEFKPYRVYLKAAGYPFITFLTLMFLTVMLDNTKFVIAARLADYIKDSIDDMLVRRIPVDRNTVISNTDKCLYAIACVSISVVFLCLIAVSFLLLSCIRSSRRIHEYCIKSLFVNSSAVIKIKKSISDTMTFLSSDIFLIDENLGYTISTTLVLLIETVVYSGSLFFFCPYSTPVIILAYASLITLVFKFYTRSAKNVQLASLESASQINAVFEAALSGSHIHRSFKKEWELVHRLVEHSEYDMRCRFVSASSLTWTSLISRGIFSFMVVAIFFIPLLKKHYLEEKVHFGFYGISTSLSVLITSSFSNFILSTGKLEILMCSIKRFSSFVPPDTPVVFEKKKDVHAEELVSSSGRIMVDNVPSVDHLRESVLERRRLEFLQGRSARCTGLKMLFFKSKVNILDVSKYLPLDHSSIELKDVSVFVKSDDDKTSKILDGITCSADGKIIGIIGRTGAGKSTLLSVLQNLARNREGSVLLDGCDLKDLPKAVTRQVIGVLPQLPFVFRGWTIRRFVDPRMLFDDSEINTALENCGLLKFVEHLPGGKGLDTIILPEHYYEGLPRYYRKICYGKESGQSLAQAEHGMALSNSQLRRLSVVRLVLYREFFKILLVDEPPEDELGEAALSNIVGTPIYELVRTYFQHCTTFIAAHDASVLRLCTSVWAFHNGSLIRICKVEDIMGAGSLSKIIEGCIVNLGSYPWYIPRPHVRVNFIVKDHLKIWEAGNQHDRYLKVEYTPYHEGSSFLDVYAIICGRMEHKYFQATGQNGSYNEITEDEYRIRLGLQNGSDRKGDDAQDDPSIAEEVEDYTDDTGVAQMN